MVVPRADGRRSQEQRRAGSHALILDAAVQGLVEDGYAATTTVAVQARAGVSRGRLLHYFPSRDAVLVAAAQRLARERVAEMERAIARSPLGRTRGGQRLDRAVELLWSTFHEPYFWAAMELWIAARTNAELREHLLPGERRLGDAIAHVVATIFGPEHSAHRDFDDLRELLFTSMRGVAVTYAIDARDPTSDPHLALWRRTARRMLAAGDPGGDPAPEATRG